MKFALTEQLVAEARQFGLRSACRDCLYWRAARGECLHGWPDMGQRLRVEESEGEAAFCKEFELR